MLTGLLPPDAKFLKDISYPRLGTHHLYVSVEVGATFPADVFTALQASLLPSERFSSIARVRWMEVAFSYPTHQKVYNP
jgi:hypothetical protein